MQLSLPCPSRVVRSCCSAVLLVAVAALGSACDRHDATEPGESYGHGSSHRPEDYKGHQIDSRQGSKHFSDSQGVQEESGKPGEPESAVTPNPGEKPATTPNPLGIGK